VIPKSRTTALAKANFRFGSLMSHAFGADPRLGLITGVVAVGQSLAPLAWHRRDRPQSAVAADARDRDSTAVALLMPAGADREGQQASL
jgi:hypothetical protein